MLTFLFWNINRKPVANLLAALAQEHSIDVLILGECGLSPATVLNSLNTTCGPIYHFPPSYCRGIRIFTRFSREFLRPAFESDRLSIRRLSLPERLEILVVASHSPSKLYWSPESQAAQAIELAKTIREQEEKVGYSRSIIVGDLNMNPFELGMVSAAGLHAMASRQVAQRGSRTVQGREYPFFFNPMWGWLGGDRDGPA